MRNSIQKETDREIRGHILKTLDFQYPDKITTQIIIYALEATGYQCTPGQLKVHLAYLAEKGYAKTDAVDLTDLGLKRFMVGLTAQGKDLIDGNIAADPGVKLYG